MQITPVSDVWGVGRKLTESLQKIGVDTALRLAQMEPSRARQRFSVVLERTICELNGESCLELDETWQPRQQIMCSRSFGEKLTQYSDLKETVCEFAARAAEKLRRDKQLALMVNVFIRTSPFDKTGPNYSNTATGTLTQPSSDTRKILDLAIRLFDMVWRDGYRYAKAGVMLGDFCSPNDVQLSLFDSQKGRSENETLMKVIDTINRGGQANIWFGGQRPQKDWFMRQANVSPAYTTRWSSIPEVK
jgi:DNA polymerase V